MSRRYPTALAGWPLLPWRGGDAGDPTSKLLTVPIEPPCAPASTTSRAAAEAIRGHSAQQRAAVLRFIQERGSVGATDQEVEHALGMRAQSVTPRRGELVKLGLVRNSGRTRLTDSGRSAAVWTVTTGGADAPRV